MKANIPTCLTFFRVLLIPFFVLAFYLPLNLGLFVSALIFIIAAITDWFDGYLARLWKQTTKFGAFLDPVADKVMVATALVLVTESFDIWYVTLPAATMIAREIIVSCLREWMAEIGKRSNIAVSWIAKFKTTAQMMSLFGLLWRPTPLIENFSITLLYLAAILTFWSMYEYLKAAWNYLKES
ncbi:CDP-diacylglycerol--glycerol-3-phosphate 3-phosphatidyltransferase [Candidatus Hartigia pinicola]